MENNETPVQAQAAVRIDSGPITATLPLRDVPREKWPELMRLRRRFMDIHLSHDCRCLVEFVNDAKLMFGELGFAAPEAMIRDGYKLEPEEIDVAVEWLRLNPPANPVPLNIAKQFGAAARAQEIDAKDRANKAKIKQGQRTDIVDNKENDVNEVERPTGNSAALALRRLRKDRPDIHARVLAGELSPHGGMVEAGFRKQRERKKTTPVAADPSDIGANSTSELERLRARNTELEVEVRRRDLTINELEKEIAEVKVTPQPDSQNMQEMLPDVVTSEQPKQEILPNNVEAVENAAAQFLYELINLENEFELITNKMCALADRLFNLLEIREDEAITDFIRRIDPECPSYKSNKPQALIATIACALDYDADLRSTTEHLDYVLSLVFAARYTTTAAINASDDPLKRKRGDE